MKTRPNILVFLTDDHGQWASGAYGHTELHTPSMDWLARTGARMRNAYTPCPVCSPARASFWTGKIPSAHGIHDHIGSRDHPGITGQQTLAELLQASGYQTGLSGKWHAHAHGDKPQPGFDYWFSQWKGTNAKAGPQPFSRNGRRLDFHGQQAPIITSGALEFLQEIEQDRPFFLFVGYTDTHTPFATLPERLVSHYRNASFRDIPDERFPEEHGYLRHEFHRGLETFQEHLAQYYAAVTLIDEQVGRILDDLENRALLEDTFIVYTSDHGHMNGHHGAACKGNATIPQNFLEESIRVPCLLRHPNLIRPGADYEIPVDHCDLHATVLAAAGLETPVNPSTPGKSYLPLLSGDPSPEWRNIQICEYGNSRMARSAEGLKLIRRYPGPNGHFRDSFFDLRNDPRELHNRIEDPHYADSIRRLDTAIDRHFTAWEDPACSGLSVGQMAPFNSSEPWRMTAGRQSSK